MSMVAFSCKQRRFDLDIECAFLSQHRKTGSPSGDTNLYGYVLNDPINYVDPNGQSRYGIFTGVVSVGATLIKLINAGTDLWIGHQQQTQIENFIQTVNPQYRTDVINTSLGDYGQSLIKQATQVPLTSIKPPPAKVCK